VNTLAMFVLEGYKYTIVAVAWGKGKSDNQRKWLVILLVYSVSFLIIVSIFQKKKLMRYGEGEVGKERGKITHCFY
jgi:hypothetical protein